MKEKRDETLVVGGKTRRVSDTLTRPANTTQYAAGDQVSDSTSAPTILNFADIGVYDGISDKNASGVILTATCICSKAETVKPNLELYLFTLSTITVNNDNAAWAPTDAELNDCIGVVVFNSWKVGSGNSIAFVKGLNIPFQCQDSDKDLYGLVVERGTYTPTSAEVFKFVLGVIQD